MRIYCFYLILNSDMPAIEKLEMPDLENVLHTVPTINQHLICDIILGLNMEEFLKEIIIFCNPTLVLQTLQIFTSHIKYSAPTRCLKQISLLGLACYRFICRLQFYDFTTNMFSKILTDAYNMFFKCINYYIVPPNAERLNTLTEDEQYLNKGHNLYSLLTLTQDCLNRFLSSERFDSEGFQEIYLYTIDSNSIKTRSVLCNTCDIDNNLLLECLKKCNETLLDKCQSLLMEVSVQVFCAWTEFEENGKSMQQTVRESCYLLHTILTNNLPVLDHTIIALLPQMSCKPVDIQDIINSSDVSTIIENASKESNEQAHWVNSILEISNFSQNEELLQSLLNNINLVETNNCIKLFKILTKCLKEKQCNFDNLMKSLAVKAFISLEPNVKIELTCNHFTEKFFNNTLHSPDFLTMNTELFNKFTASINWDINDVYNTFIQNPSEVYTSIIRSAVDNSKQCDLMIQILTVLNQFTSYSYTTETEPTLIKMIKTILHSDLKTDVQFVNVVKFITSLKKGNILSEANLLLLIVMPGLHEALLNKNLSFIRIYIQILKNGFEMTEMLKYRAPLLAMIAQALEVVRWTTHSFVADSPDTLEEILEVQMNIFATYKSQFPGKHFST